MLCVYTKDILTGDTKNSKMYATGTANSTGTGKGYATGAAALGNLGAGGYGRLGSLRQAPTPEDMGLRRVDLKGYVPDKPATMYDPSACRRDMAGRGFYRQTQQTAQAPIRFPAGMYPSDFFVPGFKIDAGRTRAIKYDTYRASKN